MPGARFLVSGKVQGVYFRASTRDRALRLGITGYAKNLADGRVDVVAYGSPEALGALERWLQHGPPAARIVAVVRDNAPAQTARGFVIC